MEKRYIEYDKNLNVRNIKEILTMYKECIYCKKTQNNT